MTFEDRLQYLKNYDPPTLNISEPYIDLNLMEYKRILDKEKDPNPENKFVVKNLQNVNPSSSKNLPVPISVIVKNSFNELERKKKFSYKLFEKEKLNSKILLEKKESKKNINKSLSKNKVIEKGKEIDKEKINSKSKENLVEKFKMTTSTIQKKENIKEKEKEIVKDSKLNTNAKFSEYSKNTPKITKKK